MSSLFLLHTSTHQQHKISVPKVSWKLLLLLPLLMLHEVPLSSTLRMSNCQQLLQSPGDNCTMNDTFKITCSHLSSSNKEVEKTFLCHYPSTSRTFSNLDIPDFSIPRGSSKIRPLFSNSLQNISQIFQGTCQQKIFQLFQMGETRNPLVSHRYAK